MRVRQRARRKMAAMFRWRTTNSSRCDRCVCVRVCVCARVWSRHVAVPVGDAGSDQANDGGESTIIDRAPIRVAARLPAN